MVFVFFFKQKTAYEMRISDWSSDVCSSDLEGVVVQARDQVLAGQFADVTPGVDQRALQRRVAEAIAQRGGVLDLDEIQRAARLLRDRRAQPLQHRRARVQPGHRMATVAAALALERACAAHRSEEHTSELQSLMS